MQTIALSLPTNQTNTLKVECYGEAIDHDNECRRKQAHGDDDETVERNIGYYAFVLEREITMKQAWVMTEAQLAFFATVLPADYHIVLRIVACLWFVATLKRCRSLV